MSPKQAIEQLLAGNKRFVSGVRSVDPMLAHLKMPNLAANGQKPFAVVLTCSDSRSPVELIFDQGVGDLFVVRVAGNVVAPSLLASIEFAVTNFGSSAVIVLGHTLCGAVKATCSHALNPLGPLPSIHLEELVGRIRPAVEMSQREIALEHPDFVHLTTLNNIRHSMSAIVEQSKIVRDLVSKNTVAVEGALLDLASGSVKMIT